MPFLNAPHLKHLGIVLDSELNFIAHVDQKIKKYNRIIGLTYQMTLNQSSSKCLQYINLL